MQTFADDTNIRPYSSKTNKLQKYMHHKMGNVGHRHAEM